MLERLATNHEEDKKMLISKY
jgi:chromosome segregation ATPase